MNAVLGRMNTKLMKTAGEQAVDPDLKDMMSNVEKALDIHAFIKNPKASAAGYIKSKMYGQVFGHFSDKIRKSRAQFVARFPDVATVQADPVNTGASLQAYQKQYQAAAASLRTPRARRTFLQAGVALQLPKATTQAEKDAIYKGANEILARLPEERQYVENYRKAYDAYSFALLATRNRLENLKDGLAAQPAGLADELRRRSIALGKAEQVFRETAEDVWNSVFIAFVPVLDFATDLDTLADGFGGLSGELQNYADTVGARGQMYAAELQRLESEANRLAATPSPIAAAARPITPAPGSAQTD